LNAKPWDARLAALLVRPLRETAVHPNHLTTVRLLVGLFGAYLFALGKSPNIAASVIVLSNFLDHTDGELARMTGKTSRAGHNYDVAADALVTVALFVCIGIGVRATIGAAGLWLGLAAGVAVAGIFHLRNVIENNHGKRATAQPRLFGFEAEDILYLLPCVTLADALEEFLYAAAIGAPIACALVYAQFVGIGSREA
jgi:archaetidylinositol phosphate synthase